MYSLPKDMDMKSKVSTFVRRLEELEMRNQHEVQAVTKISVLNKPSSFFSPPREMSNYSSNEGDVSGTRKCCWSIQTIN